MSLNQLKIAFVSGKGGVGKTMLAANFAWISSHIAKTILVDMDFQNQGSTGLFAPHIKFDQANTLYAIQTALDTPLLQPNEVAGNLYFLPAVSWHEPTPQEQIAEITNKKDFHDKLLTFIERLKQEQEIEIVILDCHGGVDAVSLSAFRACEHTLMVTEADSVTFSGTLELLNYYENKCKELNSSQTMNISTDQSEQEASITTSQQSLSDIKFIVNRLPSKYKWSDLNRIYKRYMSKNLGVFTQDDSVFCYIPFEELLSDSFGEYPFHAELAPESIFSKKVHYLVYFLLNERHDLTSKYKSLNKFQKDRYKKKVERTVISNESKNIQSIVKFFAWSSSLFSLFMIGFIPLFIAMGSDTSSFSNFTKTTLGKALITIGIAALVGIFWYFVKSIFGLMHYYKNKYQFQKSLFLAVKQKKLSVWQRLSLTRLLFLRIGTSVLPIFMILYAIILIISGLILGVTKLFGG